MAQVETIVWNILHNALPVREFLTKRGTDVPNFSPLYNKEGESTDHLFFKCELAARIWSSSSLGLNTRWNPSIDIKGWLKNTLSYLMGEDGSDDDRVVEVTSILWSIWLHHNECIFRGISCNPHSILEQPRTWKIRHSDPSSWCYKLPKLEYRYCKQTRPHCDHGGWGFEEA